MWRILGKRPNGEAAYVTVDTTPDGDVAIRTPDDQSVRLTQTRAQRLWLALGQAIERVAHRRR